MKTWLLWTVFGVGLLLTGGLMGYVSVSLLDLEEAQAAATRNTIAEENVRLALWQMDGELAPLVLDEASRPYFQYAPFFPAEGAYTRMFNDVHEGDVLLPSPLIRNEVPEIEVHFQFEPDGTLTSPQVPQGDFRTLAEVRYLTPAQIDDAARALDKVRKTVTREQLIRNLPERKLDVRETILPEMVYANESWAAQNGQNKAEYQTRSDSYKQQAVKRAIEQKANYQQLDEGGPVNVREGPMSALWVGDALVLARRISLGDTEYVQGCLLDWKQIESDLHATGAETVPNATFRRAPSDSTKIESASVHRLAALPVEVLPGDVPVPIQQGRSPLRLTMYIAWACLALVALSLAFVLQRTLGLAQRRAEFVSAVSHELRTPLTTFRMYTEMLTSGRVRDDDTRTEYLNTLHSEALRLGHLVENVLAYARLENSSAAGRIETLALSRLFERATERLKLRTEQAGMQLTIEPCDVQADVRADPGAVEQIVFNLVDNACKYAVSAEDKRIHVGCVVGEKSVSISVRDHGPGINKEEGTRLFKPFRKSAQAAANSAPGVGLGLTLSRRLARAMGGNLTLEIGRGANFVLTLPRA
ncbi:MAG: HAMP domain-containing histidine kinase [Planctomycetes bacterium]|nr:HAMP domain-containing histidine kinase [Planctomycetota bacterium]